MRKIANTGLAIGLLLFFPAMIAAITFWQGSDAISEIAIKNGWCSQSGCSDEDLNVLSSTLISETEFKSRRQIIWCLGVDSWHDVHVRKGGFLIGPIIWAGNKACPA